MLFRSALAGIKYMGVARASVLQSSWERHRRRGSASYICRLWHMAAARGFRAIAAKASCWWRAAAFTLWQRERCFCSSLGEGLAFSYMASFALRRNAIGG